MWEQILSVIFNASENTGFDSGFLSNMISEGFGVILSVILSIAAAIQLDKQQEKSREKDYRRQAVTKMVFALQKAKRRIDELKKPDEPDEEKLVAVAEELIRDTNQVWTQFSEYFRKADTHIYFSEYLNALEEYRDGLEKNNTGSSLNYLLIGSSDAFARSLDFLNRFILKSVGGSHYQKLRDILQQMLSAHSHFAKLGDTLKSKYASKNLSKTETIKHQLKPEI